MFQDGPSPYSPHNEFFHGFSSLQMFGIIVGTVVLLVLIVITGMFIIRQLKCPVLHFPFSVDRQVLVVEGPEEGDSYIGEEEEEEEEENELHQVSTQ